MCLVVLLMRISCNTHAMIIYCDYGTMSWNGIEDIYECSVTAISAEKEVTDIRGDHKGHNSNYDVEGLYVGNIHLTHIPKGIGRFFPSLRGIYLKNSGLQKISADDFKPFPYLTRFDSWNNKLESLDGNIFKYTPEMKWITFNNNSIIHVGENLLTNLAKLWDPSNKEAKKVDFRSNPCIDFEADSYKQMQQMSTKLQACFLSNTSLVSSAIESLENRCGNENFLKIASILEFFMNETASENKKYVIENRNLIDVIARLETKLEGALTLLNESQILISTKQLEITDLKLQLRVYEMENVEDSKKIKRLEEKIRVC